MAVRALATGLLGLALVGALVSPFGGSPLSAATYGAVFVAFAGVGWLVARRQPGNTVGWLLLGSGALGGVLDLVEGWHSLATLTGWPGAAVAAWIGSWLWAPLLGLTTGPLLVLFPDGRLPSRRWRAVVWAAEAFVVLAIVGNGLYPWPAADGGPNPYGIAGAEPVLSAVQDLAGLALMLSLTGGVAALGLRYRRGSRLQRQQLKWFLAAAALLPFAVVAGEVDNQALQDVAMPAALLLLVAATGVAILRHRLYDIDRIISRTLGYALLTALLAAVYLTAVTVLTTVSAPLTGDSPLAVAAATLAAAAVFRPARARVQTAVNRRFDRGRYDASRTVEAYRGVLREEVDLDALGAELLAAVRASVQPAAAALWINPTRSAR